MGITIAGQTAVFLQSLLLGAVLGCFYDLFRITRIAFLMPALLVLIEDLLFFLFSSIALFGFLLENNDGQIRWFILLGVVLGSRFGGGVSSDEIGLKVASTGLARPCGSTAIWQA